MSGKKTAESAKILNPTTQRNNSSQINMSSKDTSEVHNREPLTRENAPCQITLCLCTTPCQPGWLHWLKGLLGERFTVKTNQDSPSSMSLEKRVRIRPRGVVSKKCIGQWRIRLNSLSWSTEAAFTVHCQHRQHMLCLNTRPDTCKQQPYGHIHCLDKQTVGVKLSVSRQF